MSAIEQHDDDATPSSDADETPPTGEARPATLVLTKPIDAHGEQVDRLTFRPLGVEDLVRVGYPIKIGADGTMEPLPDRISALISRLARVPRSSVAQMDVGDWHKALEVLLGFFGKSVPARIS